MTIIKGREKDPGVSGANSGIQVVHHKVDSRRITLSNNQEVIHE